MSADHIIDDTAYFEHKRATEEHRARHPEQYAHPLVGAWVRAPDGSEANVLRVVGTTAILDRADAEWPVDDLVRIPRS